MTRTVRFVARVAVLVALVAGTPVQTQTPEIDALRERAEQGDAEAQYDLGNRYFENADAAEAVRWYRLAAEQGHTDAQSFLGLVLASAGLGIPRDGTESMYWLRLAAENGDARAQFNLGRNYERADDVPRDLAEGLRLYRLAAEQGYAEALFALGDMCRSGRGVEQDDVQAYLWYELAASREHAFGARSRDRTANRLTPEQVAEAQRLAREWDEAHPR